MDELPREVIEILGDHHTLTLATASGSRPWASQVFFAEDVSDGRVVLYFATLKPSRKWRDLKKNPIVSFAVGTEMPRRWLQGGGVAEPILDAVERRRISDAIALKTPSYERFISAVTADLFRIVVDEIRVVDLTTGAPRTTWMKTRHRQATGVAGFISATRAQVLPVTLAPVVLGSLMARSANDRFSLSLFAVTIIGAAALHLAANVINDVFDMRSGADRVADALEGTVRTGSPYASPRLAIALLAYAAMCGGILVVGGRPLALAFGAAGAALAYLYVAPPSSIAYRGRGLGEVLIVAAFGPLPVAGAYYVQAGNIPAAVWLTGILPGLLTTRVLFHHHFLHYRADRLARKMTPVAAWGPDAMLSFSRALLPVDVVVIAGLVLVKALPALALASILGLIPLWRGLSRAAGRRNLPSYLALLRASVVTSVGVQALVIATLLLTG